MATYADVLKVLDAVKVAITTYEQDAAAIANGTYQGGGGGELDAEAMDLQAVVTTMQAALPVVQAAANSVGA